LGGISWRICENLSWHPLDWSGQAKNAALFASATAWFGDNILHAASIGEHSPRWPRTSHRPGRRNCWKPARRSELPPLGTPREDRSTRRRPAPTSKAAARSREKTPGYWHARAASRLTRLGFRARRADPRMTSGSGRTVGKLGWESSEARSGSTEKKKTLQSSNSRRGR